MTHPRCKSCSVVGRCPESRQEAVGRLEERARIMKELDAMDDRREIRKNRGVAPPASPASRPSRDFVEAAVAVAQVTWYAIRMGTAVVCKLVMDYIRKGLGKKRSD